MCGKIETLSDWNEKWCSSIYWPLDYGSLWFVVAVCGKIILLEYQNGCCFRGHPLEASEKIGKMELEFFWTYSL